MRVGTVQFTESLNRTRGGGRGDSLPLMELGHPPPPARDAGASGSCFSHLWTQTRTYPISSIGYGLNYTTGFPGSPPWDFSASISTWANSYKESFYIDLYQYIDIPMLSISTFVSISASVSTSIAISVSLSVSICFYASYWFCFTAGKARTAVAFLPRASSFDPPELPVPPWLQ